MDWQDAFEGFIPANRLMDAFVAALEKHTGPFPVNAFEILDAWKAIKPARMTDYEFQIFIEENNRPRG